MMSSNGLFGNSRARIVSKVFVFLNIAASYLIDEIDLVFNDNIHNFLMTPYSNLPVNYAL